MNMIINGKTIRVRATWAQFNISQSAGEYKLQLKITTEPSQLLPYEKEKIEEHIVRLINVEVAE